MDHPNFDFVLEQVNFLVARVKLLEDKVERLSSRLEPSTQQLIIDSNQAGTSSISTPLKDNTTEISDGVNTVSNSSKFPTLSWEQKQETSIQWVLEQLDVPSLRTARLVSKIWNKSAVPILSKKVHVNLRDWSIKHNFETIPFHQIYSLMESASDELFVFRNMTVSKASLSSPEWECQLLLREFGRYFTTMSLESPISIAHLFSVLVDWCPNLEELQFTCTEDFVSTGAADTFHLPQPLKLTTLKIGQKHNYVLSPGLSPLLTTICKSSPNLVHLSINDTSICDEFFRSLKDFPQITRNLTHLQVHGGMDDEDDEFNSLESLLDLEFGEKLKTFSIRRQNPILPKLIARFATSLKYLNLGIPCGSFYDDADLDDDHDILNNADLPNLDNLQVLKLKGFMRTEISSFEFLGKMRNLKVLHIHLGFGRLDMALLMTEELFTPMLNLKEFSFVGVIASILSYQMLAQSFPHLERLQLILCDSRRNARNNPNEILGQTWFKEVVERLSRLSSLKHLYLDSDWSQCENFAEIFRSLKNMTNLTDLEICNFDGDTEVPTGLEIALLEIPNLRHAKLFNFITQLSEAKKLFESLAKKNVNLELSDDPRPRLSQFLYEKRTNHL